MVAPIAFEPPSIQKAWQAFLQHIPVALIAQPLGQLLVLRRSSQ